jgi:hypothetical protein
MIYCHGKKIILRIVLKLKNPPKISLLITKWSISQTYIKGARQNYLCKFILTFYLHVNVFIGGHFECWKRYILLALRRFDNLCSSLTLIYVTRWYRERSEI